MKKTGRFLIRWLPETAVAVVLLVCIKILADGMYLLGVPDLKDISSVGISYPNLTEETKEISDPENMELALKLTAFLRYDLFEKPDRTQEPLITIRYYLKDGTERTVSANDTTVWWNGRAHAVQDEKMFVNLTEGIFFSEELREQER